MFTGLLKALVAAVCLLQLCSHNADARTTLAPDERLHVNTIVAKLTKVKGGQHGRFTNSNTSATSETIFAAGDGQTASTNIELGAAPSSGNIGLDGTVSDAVVARPALSIQPPYFDFRSHFTCISTSQEFMFINNSPNPDDVLQILSVTTGSLNFHVSNFSPISLAPNRTKSIKIMFLPYMEGFTSAVVVIQTSIGGFLLRLTGEGINNPYGVSGFTRVRVPIGVAYNPAVQVYNPFDEVLSIKEIYTSESFFHLTLPDFVEGSDKVERVTEMSTSASIWKVKPREIKDVIELSFRSHTPGPYRGFLHIKTDLDNLVVPIDIVVLTGGIHASPEKLDFGATVPGEGHTIPISLLNSDDSPVAILEVVTRNIDDAISIKYDRDLVLKPQQSIAAAINVSAGRLRPIARASVPRRQGNSSDDPANFSVELDELENNSSHAVSRPALEGERNGYIVIRTNQSSTAITKIPYSALFIKGYIGYQEDQLMFPLFKNQPDRTTPGKDNRMDAEEGEEAPHSENIGDGSKNTSIFSNRTIQLVNNFGIPLAMQSITLPDSHFGVNGLVVGSVALPGEAWPAFYLHFNSGPKKLMYNTTLFFHTNVTMHRIPIQVYHGLLDISTEANVPRPAFAVNSTMDYSSMADRVSVWSKEGGGLSR